jgi:hypothetical protein
MPNFNNCQTGIYANATSTIRLTDKVLIKDANNSAITLRNSSYLSNAGVSGSTGSSFEVVSCVRGFQIETSHMDVSNARIIDTRYGLVSANASTFNLNKSVIEGGVYSSFTGQAYGLYISDASSGNFFESSVTGYVGGTGSQTSGNFAVFKNSTVFVGATSQKLQANTTALGADLQGSVVVDTFLGNKITDGDRLVVYIAPEGLPD